MALLYSLSAKRWCSSRLWWSTCGNPESDSRVGEDVISKDFARAPKAIVAYLMGASWWQSWGTFSVQNVGSKEPQISAAVFSQNLWKYRRSNWSPCIATEGVYDITDIGRGWMGTRAFAFCLETSSICSGAYPPHSRPRFWHLIHCGLVSSHLTRRCLHRISQLRIWWLSDEDSLVEKSQWSGSATLTRLTCMLNNPSSISDRFFWVLDFSMFALETLDQGQKNYWEIYKRLDMEASVTLLLSWSLYNCRINLPTAGRILVGVSSGFVWVVL